MLWDPPRKEVGEAIRRAHGAGVRVLMMTGDHPGTALAVAAAVGIAGDAVLTGEDIEHFSRARSRPRALWCLPRGRERAEAGAVVSDGLVAAHRYGAPPSASTSSTEGARPARPTSAARSAAYHSV